MDPPPPAADVCPLHSPRPDRMDIDSHKSDLPSRRTSSGSNSNSRSSSSRRESLGSIEEESTGIAQSFVDKGKRPNWRPLRLRQTALNVQSPTQTPDFCCPCGGFLGWKQIRLGGRRASRSYSDLRILGGVHRSRGWAWEETPEEPAPAVKEKEQPPKEWQRAPIENLPAEILDQIISNLALDIPPNGYTPRNVDLISCLLTSRTLHSATLGVLYRHITIPHSIIFSKALNHIKQYPSLGTIVRRLDFSHFSSVGLGRTQQMNVEIQNLTWRTLLECLNLLPNLKELLLQEHVEDDVNGDVTRKILSDIPTLRAVDFCGCSSPTFSSGFVGAVTQDPNFPAQLRTLRRVSLHECTSLPDEAFQALLPRLINLTHLDVAHTQITNKTLFMIPQSAQITHLSLSRCTRLTGPEVVEFLTTHPAVTDTLVYLNLMSDASRHRILEEEDVETLLPHLTPTLRSLNLGGARITSAQMPMLLKLSKHVEELGLNSANITIDDINSFFRPFPLSNEHQMDVEWVRPALRYLDLTKNPHLTQATLLNPKSCLLVTPQSYPLHVIELTERIITPLRQRSPRNGWVVRDLGRRGWYVREPPTNPNEMKMMPRDDGRRSWKMGARWWGMRKIPVCVGDVGGIYGHYMFKK
ncbi:leucine Rich Repeat domain containing protein [Coccidioides immitis RMSCC 2394]|uniref:Leucine Rich Repeat domain containing protein n=1 Tax=Coccidioides immitis RMSCC 2394 TaxID=404692 RepID=A0A0J7AW60_COCIT|nr:leucine Rich Repeat domain containing protein [Coccidioides immitis RMSCC 2394]